MIIKTLVISSLVVLSTHADDIIDKCDLNNNQVIETPKMYGVTNIGDYKNLSPEIKDLIEKERKCALFIRREEKKENIKRLDESIAEKNKNIVEKNKNIAEKNKNIAEKNKNIVEKNKNIAEKNKNIAEDRRIIAKDREIIVEKNKNIAEKNKNIAKYTAKINEMKQLLAILSPEEAKKVLNEEIRKTEEKIIVEKDPIRKKTLNQKLKILKERLVEIDIKVG